MERRTRKYLRLVPTRSAQRHSAYRQPCSSSPAGTGKTTTIKAAFEYAPEAKILYAVFNKKNQKEAESKITDDRVEVKTLHSLGFAFIKRVWGNAKPDNDLEFDRAEKVCEDTGFPSPQIKREVISAVTKLVSFCKNMTINTTIDDVRRIADERDIYVDGFETDHVCALAMKSLEAAKVKEPSGKISFDDMVWLPCAMNWVRPWFDLVCIDEAQDMNLPQLTMARASCKPGGRIVVVGDSRQAIYGFRGAVQNAMSMMKVQLRASELGLTTTYRCPKRVVELAQKIVPDYKAAPSAPEGVVKHVGESNLPKLAKPGDAILSRLNAPLMPIALSLIRSGIAARIEGRDIARQLISMARTLKASNIEDFLTKLEAWKAKQISRLASAKNADKKIEQIEDIAETLRVIAESAESVGEVERKLNDLFQDSSEPGKYAPCVILSSVHKAKGLEWSRVFILSHTFARRKESKPGDVAEAANIYYVAITRSKRELYLVSPEASNQPSEPEQEENTRDEEEIASGETQSEPETTSEATPEAKSEATRLDEATEETPLPGQVYRTRGSVFLYAKKEYVTLSLSKSNAKAVCLERSAKVKDGEEDEDDKKTGEHRAPRKLTVSCQMDRGDLIRVMTESEIEEFLNGIHRGRIGTTTSSGGETNDGNNSMKNKSSSNQDKLAFIVTLVKAGKTEAAITAELKKEYGEVSNHSAYIIGREWRRVNKVKKVKGEKPAKAAAKPAAKPAPKKHPAAPVKKSTPPARPAKPVAPKAKATPAVKPVPPRPTAKPPVPPRPAAPAAEPTPEAAPEAPEAV